VRPSPGKNLIDNLSAARPREEHCAERRAHTRHTEHGGYSHTYNHESRMHLGGILDN